MTFYHCSAGTQQAVVVGRASTHSHTELVEEKRGAHLLCTSISPAKITKITSRMFRFLSLATLIALTDAFMVPATPAKLSTSPIRMQVGTPVKTGAAGAVAAGPGISADSTILVQGGSLRTWSYRSPAVEQVQVVLSTEGRPLDADIELWHGPDNTPCRMRVYGENGKLRPFSAVITTPRGPNTVAIRNIGQLEFPFAANVLAETPGSLLSLIHI